MFVGDTTSVATIAVPAYPLAPWIVVVTVPVVVPARVRFPLPAFAAAAVIGLGTGGQGWVLPAVMSASLAYQAGRWWQVAAGLGLGWVCFTGAVLWQGETVDPLTVVLFAAAYAPGRHAPAQRAAALPAG